MWREKKKELIQTSGAQVLDQQAYIKCNTLNSGGGERFSYGYCSLYSSYAIFVLNVYTWRRNLIKRHAIVTIWSVTLCLYGEFRRYKAITWKLNARSEERKHRNVCCDSLEPKEVLCYFRWYKRHVVLRREWWISSFGKIPLKHNLINEYYMHLNCSIYASTFANIVVFCFV